MIRLLIKNARMINEGREFQGDLRITGERIKLIGADLDALPSESRVAGTCVNGGSAWDGRRLVGEPLGRRLDFAR